MNDSSIPQPSTPVVASKKSIYLVFLLAGLAIAYGFYALFWPSYQRRQLLANGIAAEGVITTVEPTGNVVNSQPQVRMNVRVTPEQGEPFDSQVIMVVNPIYAPQFQPGRQVKVRYDQADRSKAAIEAVATYQP